MTVGLCEACVVPEDPEGALRAGTVFVFVISNFGTRELNKYVLGECKRTHCVRGDGR